MSMNTNEWILIPFANRDPNPGIPFVTVEPPTLGVTYWLVVAVLSGLFATSIYLGVWK